MYSKYKTDVIINYSENNKKHLPCLILRYASEKLPNDRKAKILKIEYLCQKPKSML